MTEPTGSRDVQAVGKGRTKEQLYNEASKGRSKMNGAHSKAAEGKDGRH